MIASITPLEALRRLIAAVKLIDFADCKDERVWNQLGGELGVAEGVAHEPVYEEELARVRRDVEEGLGYGFMVDGRRVGMDRIVWFNRPGETALHARGLPCPDEDKILDEFNTWFGPVVADSNAHNMAIQFWAQESYRAGRLGLADEYTTPTAAVAEWVNEEQGFQRLCANPLPDGTQLFAAFSAVPSGEMGIVPDWPFCNPGCDYEDPHGSRHDGRSASCGCDAAKASIARQSAAITATKE